VFVPERSKSSRRLVAGFVMQLQQLIGAKR
jgi:hypothetical protein